MKKIFIAVDTADPKKAKKIINQSQTKKIKIGYKFGLEFMNSSSRSSNSGKSNVKKSLLKQLIQKGYPY